MFGSRGVRQYDGLTYAPGAKFRVIKEGARLTGWQPAGPSSHRGWRQDLHIGDVIECTGVGPGWGSDPGFGVEFKVPGVNSVDFQPSVGGIWNYRPAPGYLEPVEA
jgi:hypothetical protein